MKNGSRKQVTTAVLGLTVFMGAASARETATGSSDRNFIYNKALRTLGFTPMNGGAADSVPEMFEDLLRRLLERMRPLPMPPGPTVEERMQYAVDSYWTQGCPDPSDPAERAELIDGLRMLRKQMEERPPAVEPSLIEAFGEVAVRMLEELEVEK